MKIVYIFLSISFLLSKDFTNPHGKPGAITVKYSHIIGEDKNHDAFKFQSFQKEYNNKPIILEVLVPVHNNLTMGISSQPVSVSLPHFDSDDGNYNKTYLSFYNQFTLDIEFHIPIYKLWNW